MKILVVGGGGREHALAWRLRHELPSAEVLAAPGNPGIAELARCIPIGANDVSGLLEAARHEGVDWTLVGPEAPLEAGLADAFHAARLPIFGPTAAAAQLETSKAFAKTLMLRAGVPTARAETCSTVEQAERAIVKLGAPVVVKASGLAAGKGVIICGTADAAREAARGMLEQSAFGDAGRTVLIEEFMRGEELSLFVVTDGETAIPLPAAQDHKRLLNADLGPNTGGMGAYCPVSLATDAPELVPDVLARVVHPTLGAMRDAGTAFRGLLYVGLMLTDDGPKVVEFNCRFGDPETEAVLPALRDDAPLAQAMAAVARGERLPRGLSFATSRAAVTTVIAARGYPEKPVTGDPITLSAKPENVLVFHAGTKRSATGDLVTAGGRVLAVTGLGATIAEAREASAGFAARIDFTGKQYRTDIGWRELERHAGAS